MYFEYEKDIINNYKYLTNNSFNNIIEKMLLKGFIMKVEIIAKINYIKIFKAR